MMTSTHLHTPLTPPHDSSVEPVDPAESVRHAVQSALAHANATRKPALCSIITPLASCPDLLHLLHHLHTHNTSGLCFWEHSTQPNHHAQWIGHSPLHTIHTSIGFDTNEVQDLSSQLLEQLPEPQRPAASHALRFFGGVAFDPHTPTPTNSPWTPFGASSFHLHATSILRTSSPSGHHAHLLSLSWIPPQSSLSTLTQSIQNTLQNTLSTLRLNLPTPPPLSNTTTPALLLSQPPNPFLQAVSTITDTIASPSSPLHKAVLSRSTTLQSPQPLLPAPILLSMRARFPQCQRFLFSPNTSHPNPHTTDPYTSFIGVTPETLIQSSGLSIRTEALAGSLPPTHNPQLLLSSQKDLHEHALVAHSIRDILQPLCTTLHIPTTPSLKHLSNITHLHTPIHGTLQHHTHILQLLQLLHPTPAVCGTPTHTARSLLSKLESSFHHHRGWYTGALGWFNPLGDGHFTVSIRSALLARSRAILFAGAGIVEQSQPSQEWDETHNKLHAMSHTLAPQGLSHDTQPR